MKLDSKTIVTTTKVAHDISEVESSVYFDMSYVTRDIRETFDAGMNEVNTQYTHQTAWTLRLFTVLTLLLFVGAWMYLRLFLRPILQIAERVSKDDCELPPEPKHSQDEAGLLTQNFYAMVEKMRERNELTKQLYTEKERNLLTEKRLAQTRLQVFQSQINSHFLFNAMNTVVRLAYCRRNGKRWSHYRQKRYGRLPRRIIWHCLVRMAQKTASAILYR